MGEPKADENRPMRSSIRDFMSSRACSEHDEATTTPPSRIRYSKDLLLHYRDTLDVKEPPVGYNPAVLKPVEPLNKELPPIRDGMKWNRSRSMGTWAGQTGTKGGGLPPFTRLVEGGEDNANGQPRSRVLRSAISWNEQQAGPQPIPDKAFGRRNSRSDAPGRWDNNKDEQLSRSAEKRGADRWGAYGHRDAKDKPPKPTKDDELPEMEEPYLGHEPEWMHHRPSAENPERMKQHRQFAQDFEQERKMMRDKAAKENRDRTSDSQNAMIMTDEEINAYKKQLEAEERAPSVYTFDTLKEAIRSQGVTNLPPMPTTGMNTVDQIEKSLKAAANSQMTHSMPDLDRQKMEYMRAAGQAGIAAPGGMDNASHLLSMLRGQTRPAAFGTLQAPALPQSIGGFPMNLTQQQGLFAGGNAQLEKFFAVNQRPGAGMGLGSYGQQQMPTMNMAFPAMQQAGQFNQRPQQSPNPLLQLIANQQAAQSVRQKQAQFLGQLQQAHQHMTMQNSEDKDDDDVKKADHVGNMMGVLPGGQGPVPLPNFGLQGNLMTRPTAPGMFNPQAMNIQGPPSQNSLFPGGMPHMNPGMSGLPSLLMQSGGGVGRPMPPLPGLNLGVRSSMPGLMDERQMLNGQPNALQASLIAAQQGGGLNRFFGEQSGGVFAADPPTAPDRLEELKNEAQ